MGGRVNSPGSGLSARVAWAYEDEVERARLYSVCGRSMRNNGKTTVDSQRWKCMAYSPGSVAHRRRRKGPVQEDRLVLGRPPGGAADEGETSYGGGGRHVHEPRLAPDRRD